MGQYFKIVFLAEHENPNTSHSPSPEVIRHCMMSWSYNCGSKLTEHSYIGNPYVNVVEYLLSKQGLFYKTRIVWAGDYADSEGGDVRRNLYHVAEERKDWLMFSLPNGFDNSQYQYAVNHTKKEYIDKTKCREYPNGLIIHPLPLLVSEGNGRGHGDYEGNNENLCGRWARDVISMERDPPSGECGFTELVCDFWESYPPPAGRII